jgi:hypothetical protein
MKAVKMMMMMIIIIIIIQKAATLGTVHMLGRVLM